ncbi:MAG: hypothetical protein QW542_01430 [Thermoproteota archaeon]
MNFLEEAKRIVAEAEKRGVTLRVMGAVAVAIHSPKYSSLFKSLKRELTDLDFMALKKQKNAVFNVLKDLGYAMDRSSQYIMTISQRYILYNPQGLHVDIFFDKLDMCHTIEFTDRLNVDFPTIPLAELLLEKTQIVRINEKDVKDCLILIREHEITDDDKGVNARYISKLLAEDWGFYYTVTTNLKRIRDLAEKYPALKTSDVEDVRQKIDRLLTTIESEPKTVKWKIRAKIGPKQKWYKEVEEVYEKEHV